LKVNNPLGLSHPINIIGTPLTPTTYDQLTKTLVEYRGQSHALALDFTNTHIATLRRHQPAFQRMTQDFDYFIPDGMPLVWCLNYKGAKLSDRVYGPTFMSRFLADSNRQQSHYFLGCSPECARELRRRLLLKNPTLRIVGSYHGFCSEEGVLGANIEDNNSILAELQNLRPDFIWLGLGTPKQYAWVNQNLRHLKHGVIFCVGFAFDVNAGTKSDAPLWMQKRGLTWFFRLLTEPRRLMGRYLKYNALFFWYLLVDSMRPYAIAPKMPE
jgi:N-acetylglucosaminyldiphosphoundecaprenol N-acetyl-beta-D-mannosaminyltransferase